MSHGYGIWPPRNIKKCLKTLTLMIRDIQRGVKKQLDYKLFYMKVSNNKQHYLWVFTALSALDILGTDNNEEFDTCGLHYPYYLLIFILRLVARILGLRCKSFCLLNVEESGKHQK